MADVRPFRGLRFQESVTGSIGTVLCPPYDVISPQEQRALYARSPYNAVRLEFGMTEEGDSTADNRYTRAAALLDAWQREGILTRDQSPSFYLYHQEFDERGRHRTRRGLFARVRLQDWDERVVLPHERTLAKPKEDRLQLLRSCRVNLSPVLALYRDARGAAREVIENAVKQSRASSIDVADLDGQRHRLLPIPETNARHRLFREEPVYVIDGHHRYETALAYRNERRASSPTWSGEEGENFVLMTLVAHDDPGLVVLPTHRLLKLPALPSDFRDRLAQHFILEEVGAHANEWTAFEELLRDGGREGIAVGVFGERGRLRLIAKAADSAALDHLMTDDPPSWRRLDTAVLQRLVFKSVLGIDSQEPVGDGYEISYGHDGAEALRLVERGEYTLAFLLNPTPVETVMSVADAGERMPQKTTFFYPKVPTGLVMNPLDD